MTTTADRSLPGTVGLTVACPTVGAFGAGDATRSGPCDKRSSATVRVVGGAERTAPAEPADGGIFRFEDVSVDADRREVRRGGRPIEVEPQVLDVLLYLLAHRARVVAKTELLDEVWGDRFVTDSAVANSISAARQAVGDDGRKQNVIRTVHGKGYRIVADVMVDDGSDGHRGDRDGEPSTGPDDRVGRGEAGRPVGLTDKPTFGRDRALGALEDHVFPGTLVTLIGPAGVGKTHLANAAASELAERFVDGSWFVPLANVRDEDAVAHAVLDALGVSKAVGGTPSDTLLASLRGVNGLLILDNCEHLVDGCARIVRLLREAGSTVSILATSRQRLGVAGEQLIEVGVLDPLSSAALFVKRAASVGVELSADASDVASLCAQLDHLPLALELAGAHMRVLGVAELLAMLHHRLELLRGSGTVDQHHETLNIAIGSSFDTLEPSRQHTLGNLSVFAGPFDLDAATAIATVGTELSPVQAMTHVIDLAERSLLVVEGDAARRRYRLLESVRLFVAARSGDLGEVERAHVRYIVEQTEQNSAQLLAGDYWLAYAEMPRLWDNCRAAIGFAIRLGMIDEARRLLAASVDYAEIAQRLEHTDWARRVLDEEPAKEQFDDVRAGLARLLALDDLEEAQALLATVEPGSSMSALLAETWSLLFGAEFDDLTRLADTLERRVRGTGGLLELSVGSFLVSLRLLLGQDPRPMREMIAEVALASGSFGQQFVAACDAELALASGDNEAALTLADRAIALGVEHNLELTVLACSRVRTQALIALSDPSEAIELVVASIEEYRKHGRWIGVLLDASLAAQLLYQHGRVEAAAKVISVLAYAQLPESWTAGLTGPLVDDMLVTAPEIEAQLQPNPPTSLATFSAFVSSELRSIDR